MMTKLQESERLIQNWEDHMLSFCPGRNTAFELSAELILASTQPSEEKSLRVADIACGYGGWSRYFQAAATAQGVEVHFTALDDSAPRLAVYQDVLGEHVSLQQGMLLETLPLMAETTAAAYDAAFFGWAAHEMPLDQLQQVYQGIRRILKPDGLLFVADFIPGTHSVINQLSQQLTQSRRAAIMADPHRKQQEQELHGNHPHSGHMHSVHKHQGHHPGNHQQGNPQPGGHHRHYQAGEHLHLLLQTGFVVNEEVWRYMNNAMLLAINPGQAHKTAYSPA